MLCIYYSGLNVMFFCVLQGHPQNSPFITHGPHCKETCMCSNNCTATCTPLCEINTCAPGFKKVVSQVTGCCSCKPVPTTPIPVTTQAITTTTTLAPTTTTECQCAAQGQKACTDCSACYSPAQECDGKIDCATGEDELNCPCNMGGVQHMNGTQWPCYVCGVCKCDNGKLTHEKKCGLTCGQGEVLNLHADISTKCCECQPITSMSPILFFFICVGFT
jgi:hypothetical protein